MRDQDWDAWIDSAPEVIDLAGFESSSALVAALARIQANRSSLLQIINAPEGLVGLSRVLGVNERFIWESPDAGTD